MEKEQIIHYYDSCESDYRLFWDLDFSMAMHAGYWDRTTHNLREALEKQNAVMAEKIQICSDDRVLDAGCGLGGSCFFLARNYHCATVGITLSEQQRIKAEQYAHRFSIQPRPSFYEMDFTQMQFPDESFSVVWAIESVCHAQDKEKFLREAFRVLKPEGRLIMADAFVQLSKKDASMHTWLQGWEVPHLMSPSDFATKMREENFVDISYEEITSHILPSSRRLYVISLPGLALSRVGEWLGKRTSKQTANLRSARHQYLSLKKGLWEYGIVTARKHNLYRSDFKNWI